MSLVSTKPIVPFVELGKHDNDVAGGKGANLGELARAGFPVPDGFVITADAYLDAMAVGGVRDVLRSRVIALDADDRALASMADDLTAAVRRAGVPDALGRAIIAAYHALDPTDQRPAVAVRSSATAEDTAGTSFAGMNRTFTNVIGDAAVLSRVLDCWASLYGARVLAYRSSRRIESEPAIAVIVQKMLAVESSGVCFTVDPSTSDPRRIVIEAALGQGEVVVGGQIEPDTYTVDKESLTISGRRIGLQTHQIVRGPDGSDVRRELSERDAGLVKLRDEQIIAVAELARRIETHYGEPQDIEFAFTSDGLFVVQSRPITTLGAEIKQLEQICLGPLLNFLRRFLRHVGGDERIAAARSRPRAGVNPERAVR